MRVGCDVRGVSCTKKTFSATVTTSTCMLADELVTRRVEIGQRLTVIGVAIYDVTRAKLVLEANNVLSGESSSCCSLLRELAPPTSLPATVQQLLAGATAVMCLLVDRYRFGMCRGSM